MARKKSARSKLLAKRRTREHMIADLSENYIERLALLCGHTVERVKRDYGYDLFLATYDENGYPDEELVRLQLKARTFRNIVGIETMRMIRERKESAIAATQRALQKRN